jgi:hypothetical protein
MGPQVPAEDLVDLEVLVVPQEVVLEHLEVLVDHLAALQAEGLVDHPDLEHLEHLEEHLEAQELLLVPVD